MRITVQKTPNPNAMKFCLESPVFTHRLELEKGQTVPSSPLFGKLLEVAGVASLFCFRDFVTVSKLTDGRWEEIIPSIQVIFAETSKKSLTI